MTKEQAAELEKSVLPAELQQPEKQPLGMDFIQGGYVKLSKEAFYAVMAILRPFGQAYGALQTAQNNAVSEGMIKPFYEKDTTEAIKDGTGNVIGYVLKDNFGAPEEKKDNSLILNPETLQVESSKKN